MSSDWLLLFAHLLLIAVFALAGIAKLADLAGTRKMLADFGVPSDLQAPSSVLLPIAELLCAALLMPNGFFRYGAIGAGALLAIFSLAIAVNLARGHAPDCRCFGQLKTTRAGGPTLVRNAVLFGLAVFVALRGPGNLAFAATTTSALSRTAIAVIPMWVFALIGAWLLTAGWLAYVMNSEKPAAAAGGAGTNEVNGGARPVRAATPAPVEQAPVANPIPLPVGAEAPAFTLSSLGGDIVTLDELAAGGRPLLLIFTQPYCASCDVVLMDVTKWQKTYVDQVLIVPISKGGIDANTEKVRSFSLTDLWLQQGDEVGNAYGVQLFPTAVVIKDKQIASAPAEGRDAVRALVAGFYETKTPPSVDPSE